MRDTLCLLFLSVYVQVGATEDSLNPLVARNCGDCHNESTAEGELDLTLLERLPDEDRARILERVMARVRDGEMPPEDADPLDDAQRRQLLSHTGLELNRLSRQLRDDPGDVAMPRLTPYEYRNVIRDLSGGVVTDGGRLLPNEGGAGEGFSNVGAAQVMTLPQYEKYMAAAKDALRHLRVYPVVAGRSEVGPERRPQSGPGSEPPATETAWKPYARPAVDSPSVARKEVVDEIIAWYVAQQQKWGEEHRRDLEQKLGFVHAAYLEAAWHFSQRKEGEADVVTYASVDGRDPQAQRIALAPAAMKKWWGILTSEKINSPHAGWAASWRKLAEQTGLNAAEVRKRCVAIVAGNDNIVVETEDYAPPYEISFHEAKEEVLEAAEKEGHWPFRIEIGDAKELFLVVTDAGDGNRGEYAVWQRGRFVYRDGTSKPWQDAVTILGARSGREYPFGFDGEKSKAA